MERFDLFSTPIIKYPVDTSVCEMTTKELMDARGSDFYTSEDRLCLTSFDYLQNLPAFQPIRKVIDTNFSSYCEELGMDFSLFKMSCMWANIHDNGFSHQKHVHPNSNFSGVVYLDIPKGSNGGYTVFEDPRPAAAMWYTTFNKSNGISDRNYWIKPITGTMLIFPSWVEHGTQPYYNDSGQNRVSLSFNYRLISCDIESMRI